MRFLHNIDNQQLTFDRNSYLCTMPAPRTHAEQFLTGKNTANLIKITSTLCSSLAFEIRFIFLRCSNEFLLLAWMLGSVFGLEMRFLCNHSRRFVAYSEFDWLRREPYVCAPCAHHTQHFDDAFAIACTSTNKHRSYFYTHVSMGQEIVLQARSNTFSRCRSLPSRNAKHLRRFIFGHYCRLKCW